MPYVNIIVQGIEYSGSSFTISDGAFGSCFFFSTGFHGYPYTFFFPFGIYNQGLGVCTSNINKDYSFTAAPNFAMRYARCVIQQNLHSLSKKLYSMQIASLVKVKKPGLCPY